MMSRTLPTWTTALILIGITAPGVVAEAQTLDLQTLAKKTRPAVLLLTVFDASGQKIGTGTGFLVSSDGRLITNNHVIEKGASASAKAENGAFFVVEGVLATDAENDLVVLKLQGKNLPYLTLASSANVDAGTRIAVIGCPLGLEGSVTEGIISAVREAAGIRRILQISAAISPGSSGSPVVNLDGKVIGIASAVVTEGQSINFAVPADAAVILCEKARRTVRPEPIAKAVGTTTDAFDNDPDNRAMLDAFTAGDRGKVLKHAQALVKRYPDNAEAYVSLAAAYALVDFHDDAVAALQQAIKLKPDDARAWSLLGSSYTVLNRYDEAIGAFRQAIKIKPDDEGEWQSLGDAYAGMGRADEAESAYRQAFKSKPDGTEKWVWFQLAFQLALSGHDLQASYALRNLEKLDPVLAAKIRSTFRLR